MYALHLQSGHSIQCRTLKVATIKEYVRAIASFWALFSGVDFRKDSPHDKSFGHILGPVFKDMERFETVPDRREPYTPAMHRHAVVMTTDLLVTQPLGKRVALVRWFSCGLFGGFRLTEWAQHSGITDVRQDLS